MSWSAPCILCSFREQEQFRGAPFFAPFSRVFSKRTKRTVLCVSLAFSKKFYQHCPNCPKAAGHASFLSCVFCALCLNCGLDCVSMCSAKRSANAPRTMCQDAAPMHNVMQCCGGTRPGECPAMRHAPRGYVITHPHHVQPLHVWTRARRKRVCSWWVRGHRSCATRHGASPRAAHVLVIWLHVPCAAGSRAATARSEARDVAPKDGGLEPVPVVTRGGAG